MPSAWVSHVQAVYKKGKSKGMTYSQAMQKAKVSWAKKKKSNASAAPAAKKKKRRKRAKKKVRPYRRKSPCAPERASHQRGAVAVLRQRILSQREFPDSALLTRSNYFFHGQPP